MKLLTTIVENQIYTLGSKMFDLELPYPVSNNIYYRNCARGTFISPKGKLYKQTVGWKYSTLTPTDLFLGIYITIHSPMTKSGKANKRYGQDIDNVRKCLYDSLINVAYYDDKQIKLDIGTFGYPTPEGGVTVKIYELKIIDN